MSDDSRTAPVDPTPIETPLSDTPVTSVSPLVKVLAAGVVLLIIAGGATVWLLSSGGSEPKRVSRQFIDAMLAGKFDAAKSLCTNDVDFERMKRDMKRMEDWGKLSDALLTSRHVKDAKADRYDVVGDLDFNSGLKKPFTATVVKQSDGNYRLSSYSYD